MEVSTNASGPKAKRLPHYGVKNVGKSVREASELRGVRPSSFILRKVRNYMLQLVAYFFPVNSVRVWCFRKRGSKIGRGVFIGLYCIFDAAYPEYINIEDGAMIAGGNHLLAHSRAPEYFEGVLLSYVATVVIRKNVWLAINSIVLPDTTIGEGSILTAGSVASGKYPDHAIIQGNPAVVVRTYENK